MATKSVTTKSLFPTLFDEYMKPWSEVFEKGFFGERMLKVPAVNVSETPTSYEVSLAAPGLKKEDFRIDMDDSTLTVRAEKEEKKEEHEKSFQRREYNYTSFSRSFTLPEDVMQDGIDAKYQDGELKIILPKKENEGKIENSKNITIK